MKISLRLAYLAYRVYCFIFRPTTLGVRVMLVQSERVLLVRQTYVPGWFMPGGGVQRNETLEQAARREVREEVGAHMNTLKLMGAYTNFGEHKSDHNILFLCTDFSLTVQPNDEIAEARFFALDELPKDLMPGHRRRIEAYFAGNSQPGSGEW